MKEGGIGEDAVEGIGWEVEGNEVLLPDLTAAVLSGQRTDVGGTVEANGGISELGEGHQVSAGAAAKIEELAAVWGQVATEGVDVLADIVVFGAEPKGFGAFVVVTDGVLGEWGVGHELDVQYIEREFKDEKTCFHSISVLKVFM